MKQRWRTPGYFLAAALLLSASAERGFAAAQAVAGSAQAATQPGTAQEAAPAGTAQDATQVQPSNAAAVRTQQTSMGLLAPAVQGGTTALAPAGVVAPSAAPSDVVYTSDAYAPSDDPRQRFHVVPAPGRPLYAPPPPGVVDESFFFPNLCNDPEEPANPSEWLRWSDTATWPGDRLPPPYSNVTIECGQYILYDMPEAANTTLGVLNITGSLRFMDHPSVGNVSLAAQFIFVHGRLTIGFPSRHFQNHARITLLPNADRSPLPEMANLGTQVLAVVGGQLSWYGMPGGNSTPSWVRLARTAMVGQNRILVDGDISAWPIGATVVVSSTDFDPEQSEELQVVGVEKAAHMNDTWVITLSSPLQYMHYGEPMPVGVRGVEFPQSGEVILVSRNIHVTAPRYPPGDLFYEGGHLGIFMTREPQALYGVEFSNLGQQGTLGRYPLHFHLCGSLPTSFISHCSVHNSNQRCYVMHGTHNMSLTDNVAWRATGHCFMLEDGTEHGNSYLRNVGILTVPPVHMLTQPYYGVPTNETDNEPAIFWISSAGNTFKDNVAVGGNSGFLQEIRTNRAVAFNQPNSRDKGLLEAWSGDFLNNTAHSNVYGLQLYRNGFSPAHGATYRGITAYKNREAGVSAHGANMVFEQALIADSRIGIDFSQSPNANQTFRDAIVLGYTANPGNPVNCSDPNSPHACVPADLICNASFSIVDGAGGSGWRTVPRSLVDPLAGQIGINLGANAVEGVTFTNFDNGGCYQGGAVGWLNLQGVHVAVTSRMLDLEFAETSVNQFWVSPERAAQTGFWYIAYDQYGTLTGQNESYLVTANNSALLPPEGCPLHRDWNAFICTGVCYRTIMLSYNEPGQYEYGKAPTGPGSHVTFERTADRKVYTRVVNDAANATYEPLDVTMDMITREVVWPRRWRTNLLAGFTYNVTIVGADGIPLVPQPALEYTYADLRAGPNCESHVTLSAPNITPPSDDDMAIT